MSQRRSSVAVSAELGAILGKVDPTAGNALPASSNNGAGAADPFANLPRLTKARNLSAKQPLLLCREWLCLSES